MHKVYTEIKRQQLLKDDAANKTAAKAEDKPSSPNFNHKNQTAPSSSSSSVPGASLKLEKKFLLLVEKGDIPGVKKFLNEKSNVFNKNCTDPLGRSALLIAIENEHNELVRLLLNIEVDIGDGLLHAINEENIEAIEMILAVQSENRSDGKLPTIASSSFTPDITPIILAAHRDNYEIIKLLLDRGDKIPQPHDLHCGCSECDEAQKTDSLRHSKSRINAYKALASPSLIALSSKDPILTAFELSWELKRLGRIENEFKADYELLARQCQDFATALLERTRSSEELAIILNHGNITPSSRSMNDRAIEQKVKHHNLARLKLAIKYKQKKFVAHPHCQQLLASLWYEGLPGFRRKSFIFKVAMVTAISVFFPIICIVYLLIPKSFIGRMMRKPFIKFLIHSSSYLLFLLLLILAALRIGSDNAERLDSPPTVVECLIMFYIAGFLWHEVKQLYNEGINTYISDMWNLLDFATNSLYVSTITLRVVAYIRSSEKEVRDLQRSEWDSFHPTLISECFFAAANIFSTLKLVYIFTVDPHLGPLQISLGRMLNDILKFFSVYMLVMIAFACGLNQLNWFYANDRKNICSNDSFQHTTPEKGDYDMYQYCVTRGRYFTNLFEILQSLYWSTYGLIDLENLNLEYPHKFTEFIGKLMFGVYSYISLVVLVNMLIAMMNNSYQIIAEQADIEWKFARSKLWMSYFEVGGTLPVPFNIIPSPKTIYYLVLVVKNKFTVMPKETKITNKWQSINKFIKKVNEFEIRHQRVMTHLIRRYLMHRQKSEDKQGVTEDDINEIKGDISSFRFELLNILHENNIINQQQGSMVKENDTFTKRSKRTTRRQLSKMDWSYNEDDSQVEEIPETKKANSKCVSFDDERRTETKNLTVTTTPNNTESPINIDDCNNPKDDNEDDDDDDEDNEEDGETSSGSLKVGQCSLTQITEPPSPPAYIDRIPLCPGNNNDQSPLLKISDSTVKRITKKCIKRKLKKRSDIV